MKFWYDAEAGLLDPFVLVVEGSIPNEKIKSEGYWAALGTNKKTGQPITTCEWIDRWPRRSRLWRAGPRDVWRDSRDGGKSDGVHGHGGLFGVDLEIKGRTSDRQGARDVRCSRTISWRRCLTALPGGRIGADDSWTSSFGPSGGSAIQCTRAAIGRDITSREISPRSTDRPSVW